MRDGDLVQLLGMPISRLGLESAVDECSRRIDQRAGGYACFVNTHTLTEALRDRDLDIALRGATYRFADGVPLLWLAAAKGHDVRSRVSGPDFMTRMLASRTDITHGFVGGAPGVADAVARRFGLQHVSYSPPVRAFSPSNAAEDWERFSSLGAVPSLVWVGLGAPKQEKWIAEVSRIAPDVMFFGVGAAFDFLAGAKRRAPVALQRVGLEWAYRLASEPRRLWRRYLLTNARFAVLSTRELLRDGRDVD